MAKAGKKKLVQGGLKAKKKKRKGKAKEASAPKPARIDSKIFYPVKLEDPNKKGAFIDLPPLFDAVNELIAYQPRGVVVGLLMERYKVSMHTVDRALEAVRRAYTDEMEAPRVERKKKNYHRHVLISSRAFENQKFSAASRALVDAERLAGDLRDESLLPDSTTPEDLKEQALELERMLAEATKAKKAKP